MQNLKLCGFIFVLSFAPFASSASFNCSSELTANEKIICKNEFISKLDDEMSLLYTKALESANPKIYVKISQLQWLSRERNICKNESCIKAAYEKRNADLSNWENSRNSLFISLLGKWKSTNTPTYGSEEIIYENKIVPLIDNNPSNYFEVSEISDSFILIKLTDAPNISCSFIKYSLQNEMYNFNSKGQYVGGLFVEGFKTEEDLKNNAYNFQESMGR